jgi:hypothetical protein
MKISTRGRTGPLIQPLPKPVRQTWLVLHVVCSVGWIGVEIAVLTLCVAGMSADDPARARTMYDAASLLADDFFLLATLLVLITGLVLGLGTKWGLFRYYWVLGKLLIALVVTGIAVLADSAAPGLLGVFTTATALFILAAESATTAMPVTTSAISSFPSTQ